MIKLLMTWNIREGKETEYLEFLNREFTRSLMAMNVHPTDAWYAVWGKGPQVLAGGVTETRDDGDALASDEGKSQEKLKEFVVDLRYKVVEASGGFQI